MNRSESCRRLRAVLQGAFLLVLAACGGGGGGDGDPAPAQPWTAEPPAGRISGASPVPAACTGGRAGGTIYRGAEVEPFVVAAPGRLFAAWQQDRANDGGALALVSAVSDDAGATWRTTLHPMSRCGGAEAGSAGDHERSTDPWVDAAPDGTLHLLGLSFSGVNFTPGSANAMLASRSTDGGRTWSPPATLIRDGGEFFNDKGALTADPNDPRLVYAVWDRLDAAGRGPTMLARSTDGGIRWEPARAIHTPVGAGIAQTIGNRIVVTTGGVEPGLLVNVFVQIDTVGSNSTARLGVIRSTDQGLNWGAPVFVADLLGIGTRDPITGRAVRDGSILPTAAAGPDGSLWLAWQDARFSSGARDAIALSRSFDGGRTWSTPVAINRVATAAAFTPALHVRADGLVGVMHYDLRSDTADAATLRADAWLLTSRDGVSWAETHVAGPFDLSGAPDAGGWFLGDYQGLTSVGNRFVPALALAFGDASNRTDIYAPPLAAVTAAGAARHAARAAPPDGAASAAFAAAQRRAVQDAMARRLPGGRAGL